MRSLWLPLLLQISAFAASGQIIGYVRDAIAQNDFARGERYVETYRTTNGITPEMLEALSWLGRGALEAKQYDMAEKYADQTRKLALQQLVKRKLDDERRLPIALGASIEVHAQVLAAKGDRAEAVMFLSRELGIYRNTSIATRIQKNINLLTLEGKPAPVLDISAWLGAKPIPLT